MSNEDNFEVQCWNCSKKWIVTIEDKESIGYKKHLLSSSNKKELVINYADKYKTIYCDACNQRGSHSFKWVKDTKRKS